MAKAMGPFRDAHAPCWLSGLRTDVPAESPLIGPAYIIVMAKRRGLKRQ